MPTLQLNGKNVNVEASPDTPLLWVLRDHLGNICRCRALPLEDSGVMFV